MTGLKLSSHIGSAVSEILRYRQTETNILLLYYKDIKKEGGGVVNGSNTPQEGCLDTFKGQKLQKNANSKCKNYTN